VASIYLKSPCVPHPTTRAQDAAAVRALLALTSNGSANSGNGVTQAVKWAVKYHRSRAVHVTPTAFFNGIEAPDVSSGWTGDDWRAKIRSALGTEAV